MAIYYSGRELLEIAVQIEKNGFAFYTEAAARISEPETRDLLKWLAGEESRHKIIFEDIYASYNERELEMTPSEGEEYQHYIKALADSRVFTSEVTAREVAGEIRHAEDAINIAIRFEKDSLLFLHEMKLLMKTDEAGAVDQLKEEEKRHLRKLMEYKNQLSGRTRQNI